MAIQTFTSGQVLTAAQVNALQANDYNQTVTTKTTDYTPTTNSDIGTRLIMNSASATTITINTSIYSAGDTFFITNIGAGTCTVTAGTATVSTSGSLALAQYGGGTLFFTSPSAAIFFSGTSPAYGTATGGIGAPTAVTISSVDYQYLTFTSSGTLTVTKSGFFDYCAIGGGGGSINVGPYGAYSGGGGGAGQVLIGSIYLDANQTITIGAGSAKFNKNAVYFQQASNTTIAATAPFAVGALGNLVANIPDGSFLDRSFVYVGGGFGNNAGGGAAASITESIYLGYRGGASGANTNSGGGGGQSARGGDGSGTTGGTGGAGYDVAGFIGGSALFKAQGAGGGGSTVGGAAATDGVAGSSNTTPPNGGVNTGQGGGGGYGDATTGNGGSGIAYIRFKV
jgi:hypothetical protein